MNSYENYNSSHTEPYCVILCAGIGADYRVLLDNFRIVFAYNSGRIENEKITMHDTREIFENGKVVNYTGDLRTLVEIKNQKDCFEFFVACVTEKKKLNLDLIRDLHYRLMAGCYDETRYQKGERPGCFKLHDYVTGDGIGAAPEDVESELTDLLDEMRAEEGRGMDRGILYIKFPDEKYEITPSWVCYPWKNTLQQNGE